MLTRTPTKLLATGVVLLLTAGLVVATSTASPDGAQALDRVFSDFSVEEDTNHQLRTHDVAWHASTGDYLLTWSAHPDHRDTSSGEVHSGNDEIRARLIGPDGTGGGRSEITVSEGGGSKDFPKVAHVRQIKDPNQGANRPSLVVWQDSRNGDSHIYSQIIGAGGPGKVGSNIQLSSGTFEQFPGLAYGYVKGGTDVFLVTWEQLSARGESDVYGRLVQAGGQNLGQPMGSAFEISEDTSGRAAAPSVAYDTSSQTFLVVWGDDRGDPTEERDIWGQRVATDGSLQGSNFEVNAAAGLQRAPEAIAHTERDQQEFLVAWTSQAAGFGGQSDAHAQRIATDGSLRGSVIDLAASGTESESPGPLTVNRDTGHYVIPLTVDDRVDAVELGRSGSSLLSRVTVSQNTTSDKGPVAAAYGATTDSDAAEVSSDVLTVWREARGGGLLDQDLRGALVDRNADTDGDGIPDRIEIDGIRDADGDLTTDMEALGANPCRETIAVEVDYMVDSVDDPSSFDHSHRPDPDAIDEVVEAFDDAPRPAVDNDDCPWPEYHDSPDGIDFIVIVDGIVPYEANVGAGQALADIRVDNFTPEHRPYFHYNLWVHDSKEDSSRSGVCCNHGDFIVSLGSWRNNTGDVRDQSGTMMHELGHALGLGHGGVDGRNRKPNHPSIMSYTWQTRGVKTQADSSFSIDYSREDLGDVDETTLDESAGISSSGSTWWVSWLDSSFDRDFGYTDQPIDFNGDGDTGDTGLTVDTNNDGVCIKAGDNGVLDTTVPSGNDDVVDGNRIRTGPNRDCDTSATGDDKQVRDTDYTEPNPLKGSDDWDNITFRAAMAPGADIATDEKTTDELTFEEDQRLDVEFEAALSGDVAVTKTADRSEALPGDTITYTVTTENIGNGDATDVHLTDELPDGTTRTEDIGTLEPEESTTHTYTHTVPASATDGTTLTNTATATAATAAGTDERTTSNNSDTATTEVVTPVMELDKDATASVGPGEQVTYTLTYRNTGGAAAEDVTVTDTLPDGTYYSGALDDGAGPVPHDVTRNGDGTTTLTFDIGQVAADPGADTIEFTARPGLLTEDGDTVPDTATLTYTDGNDNDYEPVTATASSTIDAPAPSQDPEGLGYWRNHEARRTDETRDRIQATDDRYDADGDHELEVSEVEDGLAPGGPMPEILRRQLLATYFNLAAHRVVAGTAITSDTADEHDLRTVGDAVRFATETLEQPLRRNRDRYSDATDVLTEINENTSPDY